MVNKRATTWILAALLALCAAQAVPARGAQHRNETPIVWSARVRAEQRVPSRQSKPRTSIPVLVTFSGDARAAGILLSSSHYQRPPPILA